MAAYAWRGIRGGTPPTLPPSKKSRSTGLKWLRLLCYSSLLETCGAVGLKSAFLSVYFVLCGHLYQWRGKSRLEGRKIALFATICENMRNAPSAPTKASPSKDRLILYNWNLYYFY